HSDYRAEGPARGRLGQGRGWIVVPARLLVEHGESDQFRTNGHPVPRVRLSGEDGIQDRGWEGRSEVSLGAAHRIRVNVGMRIPSSIRATSTPPVRGFRLLKRAQGGRNGLPRRMLSVVRESISGGLLSVT